MIAGLSGTVELKNDKFLVIEVQGVSYKVFVGRSILEKVTIGEPLKLFTRLYLREDAEELYGFLSSSELEFFEMLITVSGVGPHTAMAVLSIGPIKMLATAIVKGDAKFLNQVPGIGRKTAEKIILELKDKLLKVGFGPHDLSLTLDNDSTDALVALGYTASQARNALAQVSEKTEGVENRIKEALKILGKK